MEVGDGAERLGELLRLAPDDSLGVLLIGLVAGEWRPREGGAWPSHMCFVDGDMGMVIKQWIACVSGA